MSDFAERWLWWWPYWLSPWWWKYLFERPPYNHHRYVGWIRRAWCRARNHPAGVWWYTPGGMEPDMHCQECGEDLG